MMGIREEIAFLMCTSKSLGEYSDAIDDVLSILDKYEHVGEMNLYYIEWRDEEYIVVAPSRESAIFTTSEFMSTFKPGDAKIALGKENPSSFLIVGGDMVFFPNVTKGNDAEK